MKPLQRQGGIMVPSEIIPRVPENGFWRTHGPALDAQGYELVPLIRGTKVPASRNWLKANHNTERALRRGHHGAGVGIKTGTVVGIDVDCDDPHSVEQVVSWCEQNLGPSLQRDGRRGTMLFYRTSKPRSKAMSHAYMAPGYDKPQRLEVLGVGQQVAVYIEKNDSGQPYYRYPNGELSDRPLVELTEISQQQIIAAVDYFDSLARTAVFWTQVASAARSGSAEHKAGAHQQAPLWKLEAAMAVIPKSVADDYTSWIRLGAALHTATSGSVLGLQLWDNWSRQSDRYDDSTDTEAKWASFGKTGSGKVRAGAGLIFHVADKASPGWRQRAHLMRAAALAASRPVEQFRIGDDVFYMNDVAEKLRRATGAAR